MKKVGKNSRRKQTFDIAVPEIVMRHIDKKLDKDAADTHSRYFTELAAKDIASGSDVSRGIVSG